MFYTHLRKKYNRQRIYILAYLKHAHVNFFIETEKVNKNTFANSCEDSLNRGLKERAPFL